MTVSLLLDRIQRSDLILAGVPVNMQILLMIRSMQIFIHSLDNLLVRASLEGHRFAFIVEAQIDVDRYLNTAPTRVDACGHNRLGVECRCLSDDTRRVSCIKSIRSRPQPEDLHEDAFLRVAYASEPSSVLRYPDILVPRQAVWFAVYHSDWERIVSSM